MEVRTYSNLELANIALGSLEELVRRGNEKLDEARRQVSYFHSDVLSLQSFATALEAEEKEYKEFGDLCYDEDGSSFE